jgi:hypothetical protein
MKCFEVVSGVLETVYKEIALQDDAKDLRIKASLRQMSDKYGRLADSGGPDFSCPMTRFSYVYSYVPAHAHWICDFLSKNEYVANLFGERCRVVCLGGGPGSDLVGILKFLDETSRQTKIHCEIVDGCEQWKTTWADVAYNMDWPGFLNTDYVVHNVSNPETWRSPSSVNKADLVTISFFWSEIIHLKGLAEEYVGNVLSSLKQGAAVVFVDNNHSDFYHGFDSLCERHSMRLLDGGYGRKAIYDRDERASDLKFFTDKFGKMPRLQGDLAWRILVK